MLFLLISLHKYRAFIQQTLTGLKQCLIMNCDTYGLMFFISIPLSRLINLQDYFHNLILT